MQRSLSLIVALLLLGAGSARAAVECPAAVNGHPLASLDGVVVFDGPPEKNIMLAPASTRPPSSPKGWQNTWTFTSAHGIVVVCRYAGISDVKVINLPDSITICNQTKSSFACR
jgi:hypothetical protein